jgi:trehalose 6-phosphate phosphatase
VRRTAGGRLHDTPVDQQALDAMTDELGRFAAVRPGLLVERKSKSVALHYRLAPALGPACRAAVEAALATAPGFALLDGKRVYEIRSPLADKGHAIAAFMAEAPFAGRRPVFAGDDATDEEGFELVNRQGGFSIKIGPGASAASYRLESPSDLRAWLVTIVQQASGKGSR